VPDAYETSASDWKVSISFATAAARLSGLVKGAFRGIEVLTRGVSPRIVTAEVLGSRGASTVSGPELEARLGLQSAWAYFSVKTGASVKREPDASGQAPFAQPAPESPPAGTTSGPATSAPAGTTTPQGGATAPASTAPASTASASAASLSATGGAQAE
jgi:stage II sporulation protein D